MSERREYYRIRTLARVGLRSVVPGKEEEARLRVKAHHTPPAIAPGTSDESRVPAEYRSMLELAQRVAFSLERIERRIDALARERTGGHPDLLLPLHSTAITLSGSGFSGAFDLELAPGTLIEATLDLWDAGLPLIPCLARVMGTRRNGDEVLAAMNFEELISEDRERIIRLTIRSQSQALRHERIEESI